jgi:very-short-patch-repair endonuclease
MNIFVTHETAIEYWRKHGTRRRSLSPKRQPSVAPSAAPQVESVLQLANELELTLPISITVSTINARRKSKAVHSHLNSKALPTGSFLQIKQGDYVSSPELCYCMMAGKLSTVELALLGLEFCGSYSLHPSASSLYYRDPLTSAKKLASFVALMAGAPWQQKALRALRYIVDGSASPMESILFLYLTLPCKLGGYALPQPKLNHRIVLPKSMRSNDNAHYVCDFFWLSHNVAAEYDSNMFHTGANRIARDSKRRNILAYIGIDVTTITTKQLGSVAELDDIARKLARNLSVQLRAFERPGFRSAQLKLRRLLKSNPQIGAS